MRRIAWPSGPEWTQSVQLEGKTYRLRARWNIVSERWTMDLLTSDLALVIAGIRLVPGVRLLRQFRGGRLPTGDMVVTGEEPVYNSFAEGRSRLLYVEAAEYA